MSTSTGSTNSNAVFYLYADSFDPNNSMSNCVAADNTYPFEIIQNLTTTHVYFLVMVDDHGQLPAVNYNVLAQGPGNVVVDQGGEGGVIAPAENQPTTASCRSALRLGRNPLWTRFIRNVSGIIERSRSNR